MLVRAIKLFGDKKEGVARKMGDTFTVSEERYKELRTTKFGALVEKVAEASTEKIKKPSASNKNSAKK